MPLRELSEKSLARQSPAGRHVDAVQTHGTAEARVIRHRIGAGAGGDLEPAVEKAIPDGSAGLVIRETDDLVVIDLSQRGIDRQLVGDRRVVNRIDVCLEWMRVRDERMLLMRHVPNGGVVWVLA